MKANSDTRQRLSFAVRMRMFMRFLGMTAILAAGAGAIYLSSVLPNWKLETLGAALTNELGNTAFYGALLLGGGILIALMAVVIEVVASLRGAASGRGATGFNAAVQKVLAVGLIVAVNVYAFQHPASFDLTSNKQFTLPDKVVADLQTLKSETTIVVLQQHKAFGRLSDKPDRYDYAAERKVVEKVQDTVDLFRKFGPQFNVVVLDVEEDSYKKKFDDVTKERPALRDAINAAPENSIFFFSEGKVQRMSFNEFYQLDKVESKEGPGRKGNLVLQPQGLETFVRRITAVEERRPKVAIAVNHPLLTTQKRRGSGAEEFSLAGLKKSLNDYGFEVIDLVLKKNYRGEFDGDPATLTVQETQLIDLEERRTVAKGDVKQKKEFGDRLDLVRKSLTALKTKPMKDRISPYLEVAVRMRRLSAGGTSWARWFGDFIHVVRVGDILRVISEPGLREDEATQQKFETQVIAFIEGLWKDHQTDLADAEDELQKIENEVAGKTNERSIEDFYLSDHKAKLSRLLADADLIIVPRLTIMNAATGSILPRNLHKLEKVQIEVIKDFIKAGKPVFVCAGPINAPFDTPLPEVFDDLETLLKDRGVELGRQTILFNVERQSYRDITRDEDQLIDPTVDVPALRLTPPGKGSVGKRNAISAALEVLVNSVDQPVPSAANREPPPHAKDEDQPLDIKLRALRPLALTAEQQKAQGFSGEFLWTDGKSWSERYPFNFQFRMQVSPFSQRPERTRVPMARPRLDAATDDGKKTEVQADEERSGPFAVAVAVEGQPPDSWYSDKEKDMVRRSSRLVVIGHGGLFNTSKLAPANEKLLLICCNWLLKRDDRLPHQASPEAPIAADRPWQYPRVSMSDGTRQMWHWAAFLGLPGLCAYLGLIVLMLRKVR